MKSRPLDSVEVSSDPSSIFSGADDFRWAETLLGEDSPSGKPLVAINEEKFKQAGAKNFKEKVVLAESLHNLKNVDPELYSDLLSSAKNDPRYMQWARDSYQHARKNEGESRPFEDWHRHSRFDQVLAGYVFAGDEAFPTLRQWDRQSLPIGTELRKKLDRLRQELGNP